MFKKRTLTPYILTCQKKTLYINNCIYLYIYFNKTVYFYLDACFFSSTDAQFNITHSHVSSQTSCYYTRFVYLSIPSLTNHNIIFTL